MTAIAQRFPGVFPKAGRLAATLDPIRVGLALLIIMNVSRIHQHFHTLAILRPALLLSLGAAFYVVFNPRTVVLERLLHSRPAWLMTVFFLFACLSAPFGISLGNAARFILESYSKVIVGALLLIAAIRNGRDLYTFLWAYVIGCGVIAWMSLFVFGMSRAGGSAVLRLGELYTFDANDIGVILMVGLPLALLVFQMSGTRGKVGAAAALIGIGITVARSGSRGTFVGGIVTGIALFFLLRTIPMWKRAAVVVVTAVTVILAAPSGYWAQMRTILRPEQDYNWSALDGRRELTQRGITYMLSYPIFGLGINNFWRAECLDASSEKVRGTPMGKGLRCTAPHNSYLEAAAELGFPGLFLWLILVFGGMRRMFEIRKRLPAEWRRGAAEERLLFEAPGYLAVAMVGFAVTSFFVSFAWIDIVYILTALMAGLSLVVGRRLGEAGAVASSIPAQTSSATRRTGVHRRSGSRPGRRVPAGPAQPVRTRALPGRPDGTRPPGRSGPDPLPRVPPKSPPWAR